MAGPPFPMDIWPRGVLRRPPIMAIFGPGDEDYLVLSPSPFLWRGTRRPKYPSFWSCTRYTSTRSSANRSSRSACATLAAAGRRGFFRAIKSWGGRKPKTKHVAGPLPPCPPGHLLLVLFLPLCAHALHRLFKMAHILQAVEGELGHREEKWQREEGRTEKSSRRKTCVWQRCRELLLYLTAYSRYSLPVPFTKQSLGPAPQITRKKHRSGYGFLHGDSCCFRAALAGLEHLQ